MYPDRYSAATYIKREVVGVIHTFEISTRRVEEFHSEASVREEVNGQLPIPALLSVLTCERGARKHSSRFLLR